MQSQNSPAELVYGWVRQLQYLPDFCRYEAVVILHLAEPEGQSRDVEVLTSVSAHQDEDPEALRQRLVFDAARLMRLADLGFETEPSFALAA